MIQKNEILELELLKQVNDSPRLNNRMAATKLGCSVKLAHVLLGKMVERGFLHIKKLHSRRWDYFVTPKGLTEKARLTYEFLDFSMHFYHDARKTSSSLCKNLAKSGIKTIAFLGSGDLAEIVYLGVKEWGLDLREIYDDNSSKFLDYKVQNIADLADSKVDAIIVCLYDKTNPKIENYLPDGVRKMHNMHWVYTHNEKETPFIEFSDK